MRAFIDCEFNGFGGELISMAVVCEDGSVWYRVRRTSGPINAWVAEHVMPILKAEPWGDADFTVSLHSFLQSKGISEVIADWPADLVHFYTWLLGADHSQTLRQQINARLVLDADPKSWLPHNALEDAKALKEWFCQNRDAA